MTRCTVLASSWLLAMTAACAKSPSHDRAGFVLPGADFFPEGITTTRDGSFFVGSVRTGAILRRGPGSRQFDVFVSGGDPAVRQVQTAEGLLVDEASGVLWVCDGGAPPSHPSAVLGLSLQDGHTVVRHPFPEREAFCNDLTMDDEGALYASDSFAPRILRVAALDKLVNAKAVVWATDRRWEVMPGEYGLNGLAYLQGNVYAVHTQHNELFRIPLTPQGTAGESVAVSLDRPLTRPDGIEIAADGSLLIVESGANRLVRAELQGDRGAISVLATGFEGPTTFALFADSAWVVEGQLDHLADQKPRLPFRIVRQVLDGALVSP
ncbi:hypothetical protein LZC95_26730 [Pendulispora brunnea]|uniref:Uncharacterized protein n=1 Tax=Pendulispora brunnea TaxID=2905690 RepID=A0ABZ2JUB5_9BACT